jgi:hypothetical protein
VLLGAIFPPLVQGFTGGSQPVQTKADHASDMFSYGKQIIGQFNCATLFNYNATFGIGTSEVIRRVVRATVSHEL